MPDMHSVRNYFLPSSP